MKITICSLAILVLTPLVSGAPQEYDVVVYGGNAAGVIASVAAAREGMKTVLLEPGNHLGGLVSGGLGRTDFGRKEVVGGYSLEFFERVGKRYNEPVGWYFEPHVAEEVFNEMLAETSVTVLKKHRLREKTGVKMKDKSVAQITMENKAEFSGKVFIDCTYEGDLMAQAGVSYTFGREGTKEYGETLAGVREHTPKHQFTVNVPAKDENGKLLPEISPEPKAAPGSADKKVQAYNFRLCMTDDKNNQVPFPKPDNYDPKRYTLLAKLIAGLTEKTGEPPKMSNLMHPAIVRGRKTDTNNNGAFSTDYIGGNYDYPDATYAEREKIFQAHYDYVAGFFYFLSHDPQVPEMLRNEMQQWGLAKDEFVDTNNWPHQLYVREARRMVGEYVMSQKDIQDERTKPDSIGMGSYNSDSHNVQRIVNSEGFAENEGDMQVAVKPYEIPYRMLLPKRDEAANLLVPVACSATHVAYSTVRMEPVFMITGQASGVAAAQSVTKKTRLHDVDTTAMRMKLLDQRAILEMPPPESPAAAPAQPAASPKPSAVP